MARRGRLNLTVTTRGDKQIRAQSSKLYPLAAVRKTGSRITRADHSARNGKPA